MTDETFIPRSIGDMPDMFTLATPANMRRFEDANPSRTLPDGGMIEGRRCFAWSPNTGEEFSGSAADYWTLADDEPLLDSEGDLMYLAVSQTIYTDALTGEKI